MKRVEITRWAYSPHGTFGTLKVGSFECWTLERPWMGNLVNVSCIPTGSYIIKKGKFYGDAKRGVYDNYEVQDVPERTLIDLHIGCTMHDTKGCILTGDRGGFIGRKWAVLNSARTFEAFMREMGGEDGLLTIRNDTWSGNLTGGSHGG